MTIFLNRLSRAISDLSRGVNGETTNYLIDDYSNGAYCHDFSELRYDDEFEEDDEDQGHFLIEFGNKKRKNRQEVENVAKQLENAT
jgi:hypothetical protein